MKIDISITERTLKVGSVVEIKNNTYMVMELPSCVSYECDRYGRHYLMSLSGHGYYSYPTTLKFLSNIIQEANGKVYDADVYQLEIKSK